MRLGINGVQQVEHNQGKMCMNSEHMVVGSGENKRWDFTINNIQGWKLITSEFKHRTWFPGISEVVKVVGMITGIWDGLETCE